MDNKNLYLLINPHGQSGAAGKKMDKILPQLYKIHPRTKVVRSHSIEALKRFLKSFLKKVVSLPQQNFYLIVAGGDGSLSELLHQIYIVLAGWPKNLTLGALPLGTGNDYLRDFNYPKEIIPAFNHFLRAPVRSLDLMRASFIAKIDNPNKDLASENFLSNNILVKNRTQRIGLNVISAGLEGLVDKYIETQNNLAGPQWKYFFSILRALKRFQAFSVELNCDGKIQTIPPFFCLAISKGSYFGAGMKIMPHAKHSDGYLHWIAIPQSSIVSYPGLLIDIFGGKILQRRGVLYGKAKKIEIKQGIDSIISESSGIGIDGNAVGFLPLTVEIIPQAFLMKI